ncbi:MAG: selenocysteine synthase [Planctomycetaceae bacterium]|nr:selenocysteine synthase [Planctomycetaceae bacterium]
MTAKSDSVYTQIDVPEIINAVGYATRVGGSRVSDAVVNAMADAQHAYVQIDDLQAAAWRVIAEVTGAEAGIVTCGAAAGLTLGAAACLTGLDVEKMDQLPDITGFARNQIIYPRLGPYHYDHAVRLCGADMIEIDFGADDALQQIRASIGPRTAAIGYAWHGVDERPAIHDLAELAHEHDLPLLVDGAMSLPPADNLRDFMRRGADLVTFSGGKHLGGPQASGILCGRRDLIRAAWLQMVDMDVRPQTWSLRHWIDAGWVDRAPRHGIGRSMKVGKEAIVGLIAALQAYDQRDHAAEQSAWRDIVDTLAERLSDLPSLAVQPLFPAPNGQPFSVLRLELQGGPQMTDLIDALSAHRPRIILSEHETDPNQAYVYPMCLKAEDLEIIASAIRQHLDPHA